MIADIDRFITRLLIEEGVVEKEKQVSFEPPASEPAADKIVSCYLHDIKENLTRRQYGRNVVRDTQVKVARVDFRPTWFDLHYAVTTGGKDSAERHQLLTLTLSALLKHPRISPPFVDKPLAGETSFDTMIAQPNDLQLSSMFWQAMRGIPRPYISYTVTAPLMPREPETKPLVRERVLRVYDDFFQRIMAEDHYRVSIAGFIYDEKQQPLSGVTVLVKHPEELPQGTVPPSLRDEYRAVSTDSEGFYYVAGLPAGMYRVEASAFACQADTQKVKVEIGKYAECNFTLKSSEGVKEARNK